MDIAANVDHGSSVNRILNILLLEGQEGWSDVLKVKKNSYITTNAEENKRQFGAQEALEHKKKIARVEQENKDSIFALLDEERDRRHSLDLSQSLEVPRELIMMSEEQMTDFIAHYGPPPGPVNMATAKTISEQRCQDLKALSIRKQNALRKGYTSPTDEYITCESTVGATKADEEAARERELNKARSYLPCWLICQVSKKTLERRFHAFTLSRWVFLCCGHISFVFLRWCCGRVLETVNNTSRIFLHSLSGVRCLRSASRNPVTSS